MTDQRIAGAIAAIQRGIELVAKNAGDSPREEIRCFRLAIEEITNGLTAMENHLTDLERETRGVEGSDLHMQGNFTT